MKSKFSPALSSYFPAFKTKSKPFLYYYSFDMRHNIQCTTLTRGDFWSLAAKSAWVIRYNGLGPGDCVALYFSGNRFQDAAIRLGATMTGVIPVTINWQADTLDHILYKIDLTESRLIITDPHVEKAVVSRIKKNRPRLPIFNIEYMIEQPELSESDFAPDIDEASIRNIVFTSGTTGKPKGVQLPYRAYQTNRKTFDQFLEVSPRHKFAVLVVNPMHHANSTAITDWALRRPGSHIHLIERYTTLYWKILQDVSQRNYDRLVAPVVSRHLDFLDELDHNNRLPVNREDLISGMIKIDFLVGSAPVGPTTIQRFLHYTGKIPNVRFGGTETCLQSIGIPRYLPEIEKRRIFEKGWDHRLQGDPQPGYYIGRPHPPYTKARIVKSIEPEDDQYMKETPVGQSGYLITSGDNLMSGYVKNPAATKRVFHDEWYIGLKDIGFTLKNENDGEIDFFWQSRKSAMLIRGGANYAYDQINSELAAFTCDYYQLPEDAFNIAVIGMKIYSEHEDACCVTIELKTDTAKQKMEIMRKTFVEMGRKSLSRGAKPDYVRFGKIPRNFKGAVLLKELSKNFEKYPDTAGSNGGK